MCKTALKAEDSSAVDQCLNPVTAGCSHQQGVQAEAVCG
ncbi:hypothetical protein LEMLEM_LOCUS11377 [Lemmus lemmus]